MNEVSIVGVDLAKRVFQLHGSRADGTVVFRKSNPRPGPDGSYGCPNALWRWKPARQPISGRVRSERSGTAFELSHRFT